jgi:O-antigen/teichoic acid export membrane protein
MYLTIIPIAIGGAIVGPDILVWLFGKEYEAAVPIFTLFLFTLIVIKYGGLTSTVMNAMGKERKIVVSRGMFGIANILLNLYFIPKHGALGAVMGTSIAYMIGIVYEAIVTHRLLKPKYPLAFTAKVFAASLLMGAVLYMLQPMLAWYLLLMLGTLIYFGMLSILKPISSDIVEVIEQAVPVKIVSRGLRLFSK